MGKENQKTHPNTLFLNNGERAKKLTNKEQNNQQQQQQHSIITRAQFELCQGMWTNQRQYAPNFNWSDY